MKWIDEYVFDEIKISQMSQQDCSCITVTIRNAATDSYRFDRAMKLLITNLLNRGIAKRHGTGLNLQAFLNRVNEKARV